MNHSLKTVMLGIALSAVMFSSCEKDQNDDPYKPGVQPSIAKASGDSTAVIGAINQFRAILGEPLNSTPGQSAGRREVNWDAVPATFTNNNNFPLDFFNSTDAAAPNGRKRGMVFINTGTAFRIDSSNFAQVDASYADEFIPFSKNRTIIAANSPVSELSFKIPGQSTDAFVHGFGIVFSDVDQANSTYIELFEGNKSLGVFAAPVKTAGGAFSFVGAYSAAYKVTRVKITAGNAALATGIKDLSDGGNKDLVVFDDFFYDEPKLLQ